MGNHVYMKTTAAYRDRHEISIKIITYQRQYIALHSTGAHFKTKLSVPHTSTPLIFTCPSSSAALLGGLLHASSARVKT